MSAAQSTVMTLSRLDSERGPQSFRRAVLLVVLAAAVQIALIVTRTAQEAPQPPTLLPRQLATVAPPDQPTASPVAGELNVTINPERKLTPASLAAGTGPFSLIVTNKRSVPENLTIEGAEGRIVLTAPAGSAVTARLQLPPGAYDLLLDGPAGALRISP